MKRAGLALLALGGWCAAAEAAEKTGRGRPRPPSRRRAGSRIRGRSRSQTYAAYQRNPNGPELPDFAYSRRLRALFDGYEQWAAAHEDLVARSISTGGSTPRTGCSATSG